VFPPSRILLIHEYLKERVYDKVKESTCWKLKKLSFFLQETNKWQVKTNGPLETKVHLFRATVHKSILRKIFQKGQVGLLLSSLGPNGNLPPVLALVQIKLILDWIHHFKWKKTSYISTVITYNRSRTIKYTSDWITIPNEIHKKFTINPYPQKYLLLEQGK